MKPVNSALPQSPLIPAEAGIQSIVTDASKLGSWVPAFAGTSGEKVRHMRTIASATVVMAQK